MTKEKAIEMLKNRKVYVHNKSAEIQKKLFELGFKWETGDKIQHCEYPFLYILSELKIEFGWRVDGFFNDTFVEISADEILSIEVVEPLKENDVVVSGWSSVNTLIECKWIAVVASGNERDYEPKVVLYLTENNKSLPEIDYTSVHCNAQNWTRSATKDEKQKLINVLKASKDNRAKEILKEVFGIEEKLEHSFKPFDKVLVRHCDDMVWSARFFDRMFQGDYACTDAICYEQCLPYEGNEHLHRTTNNPEDEK